MPVLVDRLRRIIRVDDVFVADGVCAHFESSGYEARPFYKTAELVSSAKVERYDGFVIDWILQ